MNAALVLAMYWLVLGFWIKHNLHFLIHWYINHICADEEHNHTFGIRILDSYIAILCWNYEEYSILTHMPEIRMAILMAKVQQHFFIWECCVFNKPWNTNDSCQKWTNRPVTGYVQIISEDLQNLKQEMSHPIPFGLSKSDFATCIWIWNDKDKPVFKILK